MRLAFADVATTSTLQFYQYLTWYEVNVSMMSKRGKNGDTSTDDGVSIFENTLTQAQAPPPES
jgi:hypothetical protein